MRTGVEAGAARRRRGAVRRRALVALATLVASACYVYVPADTPAPAPGEPVRVLIGQDAALRVQQEAGRPLPPRLEGLLVGTDDDSVRVSVVLSEGPPGYPEIPPRVFAVSRSQIVEIQQESFSKDRTLLLGLGIAAVLGYTLSKFSATNGDSDSPRGENPDAPALLTLFSLPLRR